jgi:hypothetical protein
MRTPRAIDNTPRAGPKCDDRRAIETPWKTKMIPTTWIIFRLVDPSGAKDDDAFRNHCQLSVILLT